MQMKNKLIKFLACFVVLVSGCSGDPHGDYLGVWQSPGNPPKTIEIAKDGDTYTFQDLRETSMSGKKESPRPLSKQGPQLMLNNGFSDMPMGLSGDKKTLLLGGISLTKLPDGQKVKQGIEAEFTQRAANHAACEDLRREAKQKEKEINQSNAAPGEKMKSMADMKKDMEGRATKVPNCSAGLLLY
jgi:hypothetical protein